MLKGDPFRRDFGVLSPGQKGAVHDIKVACENVWELLNMIEAGDRGDDIAGNSRDLALARTKLQESCMWAVRHVTKTGDQT